MPDYLIKIHMRKGSPKSGIRWHASYDKDWVRKEVEEKIKKTIGMQAVKWVDVEIAPHLTGTRIETKHL